MLGPLGKRIAEGRVVQESDRKNSKGDVREERVLERYVERLLKDSKGGKKLKVAWDTGNGAVGVSIRAVVDKLAINEPSRPLVSGDGIAVLMVCSRDEKNLATQSREEIADQLLGERVEMASRQLLRELHRRSVIEIARNELGLTVVERPIDRTEVYICEEMFMTGTAAQIVAVTKVDSHPIGSGVMGPITTRLRTMYEDVLRGKIKKYEHWNVAV